MENLNTSPYMHPNFKLLLLVLVSALLLLSVWLVSQKNEAEHERLLASAITITSPQPRLAMAQPLAARVQYSSLEVALEELLAGPTLEQGKAGLYSEIPKGTHLLGYSIQQNVVTVNLSKEFNQGAGATSAIERVEELKKTVRSVNPNYRLKIAVEGKPLTIVTSDGLEVGRQI